MGAYLVPCCELLFRANDSTGACCLVQSALAFDDGFPLRAATGYFAADLCDGIPVVRHFACLKILIVELRDEAGTEMLKCGFVVSSRSTECLEIVWCWTKMKHLRMTGVDILAIQREARLA